MKKGLWILLTLFAVSAALCACSAAKKASEDSAMTDCTEEKPSDITESTTESIADTEAKSTPSNSNVLPKDKIYNILFIGNSHTQRNDMSTDIFPKLVKSAGYQVKVTSITKGGSSLKNHLTPSFSTYNKVQTEINSGKYDFIVLQELLATPIRNYSETLTSLRQLATAAKKANSETKVILYSVWGGEEGNKKLAETGCATPDEITWRLSAAALDAAEQLTVNGIETDVALAGLAFRSIAEKVGESGLYESDGYHPSPVGSYIAAMTIFCTVFSETPDTVTWDGGYSAFPQIKEAVKEAVFTPPTIDEQYAPVLIANEKFKS